MNRKQFVILLVLVAIVGGAGLMLYRKQASSWAGGGAAAGTKLLGDFPVNDVAQIIVKQDTNQLTLAKKDDLWRVQERNDMRRTFPKLAGCCSSCAI